MEREENLEAAITRALEKRPDTAVPAEFAGRVMRSLPPRKQRRKMPVGRTAVLAGLLALAPEVKPQNTNFAFDLELLLLVQRAGIGGWFFKARRKE